MKTEDNIKHAAEVIQEADTILIGAGAGMGVDSGLPDFRGNQGFWKEYPALKKDKLSFQDLANPQWFSSDPYRAWGFYGHRYQLYRDTIPHSGFDLLNKWSNTKKCPSFVFTSNVDGHFQKSGTRKDSIYEVHGSINHLQCSINCSKDIWDAEGINLEINHETLVAKGELPKCIHCGGIARPNILMFGDYGWIPNRSREQAKRYASWKSKVQDQKMVAIELGAGTAISTVRCETKSISPAVVRINVREAFPDRGVIPISLGALEALTKIDELL